MEFLFLLFKGFLLLAESLFIFSIKTIDPMLKAIMILMAAMPSATNTTRYALQFGTEPDFVSSATLISTLLSLITLPVLLAMTPNMYKMMAYSQIIALN